VIKCHDHDHLFHLQHTMLSLASSKIAIISLGNAHISVRGMPLDLQTVNYLKEKSVPKNVWKGLHELLLPLEGKAIEAAGAAEE
jgi:hypothetical protein